MQDSALEQWSMYRRECIQYMYMDILNVYIYIYIYDICKKRCGESKCILYTHMHTEIDILVKGH